MTKKKYPGNADDLRKRADDTVSKSSGRKTKEKTEMNATERLVHELKVHQIELEMQNEELRQAHEELEASRERYFDLYDMAPIGYLTINEKGLILEVNLMAATLLGAERKALVKQPLFRYILPEDRNIIHGHCKHLFDTGAPQSCDMRLVTKNGPVTWVRMESSAAKDTDGAAIMRIVMSDITERKLATEELRQKNLRLLTETEKIGKVGGWEFNIGTGKQTWTEGVYKIHEVDLSYEPTLEKGLSFYTPASRPIIDQAIKRAIEHGESFDVDLEIFTAKGNLRCVHAIGCVDSDHRRVYVFFHDITEQKHAEARLKWAMDEQRVILDNIGVGVLFSIYQKIIWVNKSIAGLLGYAIEELIAKDDTILYPDKISYDRIGREANAAIQRGVPFSNELQLKRRDGSLFWCHMVAQAVTPNRPEDGEIWVLEDVTERKQAEQVREQLIENLKKPWPRKKNWKVYFRAAP